jgi:hypothetical protein
MVFGSAFALALVIGASGASDIKAFCIDFNWNAGQFAAPGTFAHASPKEHVRWYRDLGVNTIQTFCVSCDGYAWFRGSVAPVQPGMKGDFLKEMVAEGHKSGMKVMGYFCIGGNTYWGKTHPDLSYGAPNNAVHVPLSTPYLDYLCATIKDAMTRTGIDGFMVDWVWSPRPTWLECEKTMYAELFGKPFPGADKVDEAGIAEFERRAVDRCWRRIHETAKGLKPDVVIWLSCGNLASPQVAGSRMFREVDWLMNENPDFSTLESARRAAGPNTKIVQCVCGWGSAHNATYLIRTFTGKNVGFYGFAAPDPKTTLPPKASLDSALAGNAWNIERMRRAFRGISTFVRPGRDGIVTLRARDAESQGASPIYAFGDGNDHVGWWGNPSDTVSWTFEVKRAGEYFVGITCSCESTATRSEFAVDVDGQTLAARTEETGSWKTYATHDLGRVRLPAGRHTLVVKPGTDWHSMGLQAVRLKPMK